MRSRGRIPEPNAKRVLLLGAETALGRACAEALAASGATLALVAATNDAETSFAVKRLAKRLGAPVSQAIDATNEAAVRVMVRQVSKALGGLDAIVADFTADESLRGLDNIFAFGGRELDRHGDGTIVVILAGWPGAPIPQYATGPRPRWRLDAIGARNWQPERIAQEVVRTVAGHAS